jgi:hypothetical protein
MKRLGLLAVVLIGGVFVLELTLSALRLREVAVSFVVLGGPEAAAATPGAATPTPDEAAAASTTLRLLPESALSVRVRWNYRIGPTFPVTRVRAALFDKDGELVAAAEYDINCAGNSLNCTGEDALNLNFQTLHSGQEMVPMTWPVGNYRLVVARSYRSQAETVLGERTVVVSRGEGS